MDSYRRSSMNKGKNGRGYKRRPYSVIERTLGSHIDAVEKLLPFNQYVNWAMLILNEIPRTKEMEVTRAWLNFIIKNRKVPVMYDFIRLFLFSLHLRHRVRPFDAKPTDAILKQPRFDVLKAGRILIYRLVALEQKMRQDSDFACQIQKRDKNYSKYMRPTFGKTSKPQRFFPVVHLANNNTFNTKEYFATQGIPGFGRHCWYAVSDNRRPYYYDVPPRPRDPKDVLGRLADHINNMEVRKERPVTERDVERFRLTTRDWWNWRDPEHPYGSESLPPTFQWYQHSTITKGSLNKLDKKHIKKIMDDEVKEVTLGYRPIPKCVLRNVLGLDIEDSSFSNIKINSRHSRRSSSARRASITKWLDDQNFSLNNDLSAGTPVRRSITPAPFHRKDTQFPWERRSLSPFDRRRKQSPSPCDRRRTQSPCVRRRTQSPGQMRKTSLSEKIRTPYPRTTTPSPCPRTHTSLPSPRMTTPSPCPRTSSSSTRPRMTTSSPYPRTSSSSPRTRMTPSSPCPRTSSSSPRPSITTPPPCPRTSSSSPRPRMTTSSTYQRTSPSPPCPGRSTPVFDTKSNIYAQDVEFAREIAERIGDPHGPPDMVNAAIGGWLDQLESSLGDVPPAPETPRTSKSPQWQGSSFQDGFSPQSAGFGGTFVKHSSPRGTDEGFFGPSGTLSSESWGEPIEDDTYPDIIESEQDFADEMAQFEAQTGAGWAEKTESSLDFENAKELSFADQFLLPTADVQFNEDAQEAANPFGGFDESQDDWVAPPEIPPCDDAEQVVPLPKESETDNRRAGKLFLPQPQQTDETAELERISWPNRSHLYDINTDFPETDRPFEFLDYNQLRNEEDMRGTYEEMPEEEGKWLNLADVADQLGQK